MPPFVIGGESDGIDEHLSGLFGGDVGGEVSCCEGSNSIEGPPLLCCDIPVDPKPPFPREVGGRDDTSWIGR